MLNSSCPADNFTNIALALPFIHREKVDLEFKKTSLGQRVGFSLNIVNHMFMVFILVAIFVECYRVSFRRTALHATLCSFGFVGAIGEAVMVRYSCNIAFFHADKDWETSAHLLLALIGIFLVITGSFDKYLAKKNPHFRTRHGKFGKWTCILMSIQGLIGICTYYGDEFKFFIPTFYIQLIHNTLGVVVYLTGMVSQYYSYNTGFFRRTFSKIYIFKAVTIVSTILTVLGPFQFFVQKFLIVLHGGNKE